MPEISKTRVFDVFLLDIWADEEGGWQENERHFLGELKIAPAIGDEIDANDVLRAMGGFSYSDLCGRRMRALDTTDRRRIYAEDYYGSGEWWEVGAVKGRRPIYGLRPKEVV